MIEFVNCKPVRLFPTTNIKSFDCEDPDLNDFLFNDSFKYLTELYAVTYLYEYGDDTVAFFCVSNDKIISDESNISRTDWNRFCRPLPNAKRRMGSPAVKIGRLGVNKKYQKNGIGTDLLTDVKMFFLDNNKTGCRFIPVDAYNNPKTIAFYKKNGFAFITENDKNKDTRSMYFDLKRIEISLKRN